MTLDELDYFFKRRSIRRFKQKKIPEKILVDCINSARLAPSAKNIQPLEFIMVTKESLRNKIFSHIHWAGYLPSWTPSEDEQPMAYIIVMYKKDESAFVCYDVGIASAHIILFAEAQHIGSCLLKKIEEKNIKKILEVPEKYTVDTVIALGYKNEYPVIEENNEKKKYWHDVQNTLHVPKKALETILHKQKF